MQKDNSIASNEVEKEVLENPPELSGPTGPMTISDVYLAPGHLIRRAQQIAVAIFFDEIDDYNLTPVQYAALVAIREKPGMMQADLVNLIAIDRSTIGTLLKNMEGKKLIKRVTPKDNRRTKQLFITKKGTNLLERTRQNIYQVQERILEPLDLKEKKVFLGLLSRIVHINNRLSRVPMKTLVDK